jgi:hypothetical protein
MYELVGVKRLVVLRRKLQPQPNIASINVSRLLVRLTGIVTGKSQTLKHRADGDLISVKR